MRLRELMRENYDTSEVWMQSLLMLYTSILHTSISFKLHAKNPVKYSLINNVIIITN